jgi:hypothetical protein
MAFTTLLSLLSTAAIIAAGIFAGIQIRLMNRQRARESALQMLHSFQTPEFLTGLNITFELPEGLSRKEIEERVGDKMTCVFVLFGIFESLGILIYRREIDIQLVEDFFSGVIILSGRKFRRYVADVRETSGRDTYYEWYQWLFEQLEKRESKIPAIPAYVAFRDWTV